MNYVLITGTSRGLGKGLAKAFIKTHKVIGLSRSSSPLIEEYPSDYMHIFCDLAHLSKIESIIEDFFEKLPNPIEMEFVVLNSGILGTIKDMQDISLEEILQVMNVNLWSNKIILDTLFRLEKKGVIVNIQKIFAISSGASISGNRGWNAYALSKAALNMLIKLYAGEFPQKKFISLAPGLVYTEMQDMILKQNIDLGKYPSFRRLLEARNTPQMPDPDQVGEKIYQLLDKIFSYDSGSYVDIRTI